MKLKGINPLEQHIEQIVLVTVSGVFLVVVAAQFLLEPNRVKVGNEVIAPGKAFEPATRQAMTLQNVLDQRSVELPEIPTADLAEQFRQSIRGPVAPRPTLAAALGPVMKLEGIQETDTQVGHRAIAISTMPSAVPVAARAYRSTIDPTEPLSKPELKPFLPEQQPMDKAVVSVEARLDGTRIRAALLGGVPEIWWAGERTAILGVRLEREEMGADGNWGNAKEVPPPPGRLDGVGEAAKFGSPAEMTDLVQQLAHGVQEDILRPAYYRTIAGPAWEPPSELIRSGGSDPQIARLVRDLQRSTNERDAAQRALEALPQRQEPGGGGGGGGGGRGRGGVATPAPSQPSAGTDQRRRTIELRIQNEEKRIQDLTSRLRALGVDENGQPIRAEEQNQGQPQAQAAQRPVLDDSSIRIWSHDLTAEPGKTYRYRVKAAVNNPAYGRGAALVPEQQDLAQQALLWCEASAWTDPVMVPADRYYFITSASEANLLGPARAQAEVYQFFYGYYRKGTASLEPGDPILAQVKLPDSSKLPIFDMSKPIAAEQPGAAPPPAGGGGVVPQPGGGKGAVMPGGEVRGNPQPQVVQQAVAVALPENAKGWDRPITASENVILLDVARRPGESQGVAVLRGPGGELLHRLPDQDPTGMLKLVADSAKEGENQGQPVVRPAEAESPRVQPSRLPDQPPSTPPPGGGGGGGGGGSGGG